VFASEPQAKEAAADPSEAESAEGNARRARRRLKKQRQKQREVFASEPQMKEAQTRGGSGQQLNQERARRRRGVVTSVWMEVREEEPICVQAAPLPLRGLAPSGLACGGQSKGEEEVFASEPKAKEAVFASEPKAKEAEEAVLRKWTLSGLMRYAQNMDTEELAENANSLLRILAGAFADLCVSLLSALSDAARYYRCARLAILYALSKPTSPQERSIYRLASEALQRLCRPALVAWSRAAEPGVHGGWSIHDADALVDAILAIGPNNNTRSLLQEVAEPEVSGFTPVVAVEPVESYACALSCPCSGIGFGVARAASHMASVHLIAVRMFGIVIEVHRIGGTLKNRRLSFEDVAPGTSGLLAVAATASARQLPALFRACAGALYPVLPATRVAALGAYQAFVSEPPPACLALDDKHVPSLPVTTSRLWSAMIRLLPLVSRACRAHQCDEFRCAALAYRCIGDERAWVDDAYREACTDELPLWRLQRLSPMDRALCGLASACRAVGAKGAALG
jgi:hypothetical protein